MDPVWIIGIVGGMFALGSLLLTAYVIGYKRGREDERLNRPDGW